MSRRILSAIATFAALGTSAIAAPSVAVPPAAPQPQVWSVNHDTAADPVGNPFADSYGTANVWRYLGGHGTDPAGYYLLSHYFGNACGTPGLDAHEPASGDVPVESFNGSSTEYPCGAIHEPIGKITIHPSPSDDAIVAWTSPITGTVDIEGLITDNDGGGGDGVSYALVSDGTTLFSGAIPNGGQTEFPALTGVPVTAGDTIYLHVGANGSYIYDSTGIDLTITQHLTTLGRSVPAVLGQGAHRSVVIHGAGFTQQSSVSLDNADGIAFGSPITITPTKITVPLVVDASAPVGQVSHWYVNDPSFGSDEQRTNGKLTLTIDAAPVVDSVSPDSVVRGSATELTLTGSGFQDGMRVRLSGGGVTQSAVTVDSPTQARVTVTIDPAQRATRPGHGRSITVINRDGGTSVLANAVAVS